MSDKGGRTTRNLLTAMRSCRKRRVVGKSLIDLRNQYGIILRNIMAVRCICKTERQRVSDQEKTGEHETHRIAVRSCT